MTGAIRMLHWSADYIGLPWGEIGRDRAGVDCWGLAFLALQEAGAEVARYDRAYACVRELAEISALLTGETTRSPWRPVASGAEQERDLLVFRRGGIACHVGLVAGRGLMLHIAKDRTSCIERYDSGIWKPRLAAIYRHEALA